MVKDTGKSVFAQMWPKNILLDISLKCLIEIGGEEKQPQFCLL